MIKRLQRSIAILMYQYNNRQVLSTLKFNIMTLKITRFACIFIALFGFFLMPESDNLYIIYSLTLFYTTMIVFLVYLEWKAGNIYKIVFYITSVLALALILFTFNKLSSL